MKLIKIYTAIIVVCIYFYTIVFSTKRNELYIILGVIVNRLIYGNVLDK